MSGEPREAVVPPGEPVDGAAGARPQGAPRLDGEPPRTVRAVPRPGSTPGGPPSIRKPPQALTLPSDGVAKLAPPPQAPASDGAPSDRSGPESDDGAPTERRPSFPMEAEPTEGPPDVRRFLTPLPLPPRAEVQALESSGTPRRRSRRTVKIPDDAVPHQAAPSVAPPAEEPAVAAAEPLPPPSAAPRAAAPPIPRPIPKPAAPPDPVVADESGWGVHDDHAGDVGALARGADLPLPPVAPSMGAPVSAAAPAPVAPAAPVASAEAAPSPPSGPPLSEVTDMEVIRPMRIISIGSVPPPSAAASPPSPAPPPPAPVEDEAGRRTSRPPLLASPELEAFVTPPLKPPKVEEIEAIADDEPEEALVAAPRGEEIVSIPDDEVVPDRITGHDDMPFDIPVDVVEAPPPTKKPPPPPPKRAVSVEMPIVVASSPVPPQVASPPPPESVRAAPPPPPPVAAVAAAPPPPSAAAPPSAPTLDVSARKRQKPWWEEIFSDDYLRTMEKVEPRVIAKECDFIEERLGLEKGAVILDVACGPGAHAVELAGRGYNVVGYDLSLAMLARAQDEAQDRGQKINFLQGDMREMAFEEAFDGMYCWGTSFGYFEDDKNLGVLSRIHRGLRKGGMLLLDLANRDYICPRQPSLVWFEGDGCVCMDEMHVDFFSSRLRVKRTVMFDDGRARECEYGIRIYALHELGKMLHDTGFKVVEVTGHPAHPGVFFGSESPRIIVLAERA